MESRIVITTQPADQAGEMLQRLREAGFHSFNLPMIETRNLYLPPGELQKLITSFDPDWLVFTSKNGVRGFFANLSNIHTSLSFMAHRKFAVVGKSTSHELEKLGFTPHFVNPGNDGQSLAQNLLSLINPESRLLLALGTLAPNLLINKLSEKATVKRIDVYETVAAREFDTGLSDMIRKETVQLIMFTSPSGFDVFQTIFPDCRNIPFGAIGNTTAAAIRSKGYNPAVVPCEPNLEAMVNAIKKFFDSDPFH